jgi:hypothetical protein
MRQHFLEELMQVRCVCVCARVRIMHVCMCACELARDSGAAIVRRA